MDLIFDNLKCKIEALELVATMWPATSYLAKWRDDLERECVDLK